MAAAARLFAHQGGWDEILLVVAPLCFIALMLWLANRRLTAQLEEERSADGKPSTHGGDESSDGNLSSDDGAEPRERS